MRYFGSLNLETATTSQKIDRSALSFLRDREGELGFPLQGEFFPHRTDRHAVTIMAPRVLFAPLTVLSPGPRLAGSPSTGTEM